jgi:large subunit ribosomal protein L25
MAEVLNVKARENTGKQNNKRLRIAGMVPAVLYGHGENSVNLAITRDDMSAALRHHARVVELKGAVNEKALIRDTQWDVYGIDVLHVDFSRVSEHERVTLQVPIELRGEAPGVKEGGAIEVVVHELEVECEAESIPEKIGIIVKELHLGGEITAGDIALPAGVTLVTEADVLIVHCVKPKAMDDIAGGEGAVAEPEIIGRKPGDESEEDEK